MREKTIFTIYILIGLFAISGTLFLLIMPIDKNIFQNSILILVGISIGLLLVYVKLKNYSYKDWFRIDLIIHQPLMIAIFTTSIFIIDFETDIIKSWFYIIISLLWIIIFVLSIFTYRVNIRYSSGYFKTFKEGEINKVKSEVDDFFNNEIKNTPIKHISRNNTFFHSNEEIIELPKKSIIIQFKGKMIVISGRDEKDTKKMIKKIDDYLYPI